MILRYSLTPYYQDTFSLNAAIVVMEKPFPSELQCFHLGDPSPQSCYTSQLVGLCLFSWLCYFLLNLMHTVISGWERFKWPHSSGYISISLVVQPREIISIESFGLKRKKNGFYSKRILFCDKCSPVWRCPGGFFICLPGYKTWEWELHCSWIKRKVSISAYSFQPGEHEQMWAEKTHTGVESD